MKTMVTKLIMACLAAFLFIPASLGQSSIKEIEELQKTIETLQRDINALDLRINKAFMESFIEYCEINKYCPAIFMYKGFDSEELYRNVNHIGGLNDSYQACIKEWDAILWKDTRYRKAKKKQRNSSNKESWDKASEEITYAIRRMNSTSDEYKETRKRMDELVVNRNIAITRYLLEDCQRKGKVLPVTGVITDVIQADILRNSFEIPAMQEDRRLMQNQLQQLKLRLVRGTYDVNQKVTNRIL